MKRNNNVAQNPKIREMNKRAFVPNKPSKKSIEQLDSLS